MGFGLYCILLMDNLLVWNVRGLNGPNKQKEVKLLRNRVKAGIVGIVETKIKASRIKRVAQCMYALVGSMLPNLSGRIFLTWRPYIFIIDIISKVDQVVTLRFLTFVDKKSFSW